MTSFTVTPVESVAEAVERMDQISAAFGPADGVRVFNTMYLAVTTAVAGAITSGFFANSTFLDRLDVTFANRYFAAIGQAQTGGRIPQCWKVLWDRRAATDVVPIQFAIAGMNAHINHDLALALVDTFTTLGGGPRDATMHADFQRVNTLLGSLDPAIRRSFESGLVLTIDHDLRGVPDCVDRWSITGARTAAWRDAEGLWAVRNHRDLSAVLEHTLDDAVAAAGVCLLAPIDLHDKDGCAACRGQGPLLA